MSENTSVQFWKFEIEVVGKPSVLFSNPVVLNVLCSTLTSHEQQVVVKIGFSMRNFAHIVIVTKGEEAKDLLLRSYSSRLMFNELKNIANNLFSDICVKSVELVEMGLSIFDGQHLEFEQVKRDVKKLLETIDGALTTQSELILSNSLMIIDDELIVTEVVTSSIERELLENISTTPITSSIETSSAVASNSEVPRSSSSSTPQSSSKSSFAKQLSQNRLIQNGIKQPEKGVGIEELLLRNYQHELANPGLTGKNCIVLAPTGTGKTIVAAYICKQLIEKRGSPRILFLVPRVTLVAQQYRVFQRFLGNVVFQVSGDKSSAVPTEISIEKHLMTVMTAQILLNLLEDGRIKIESIDLLIFDECHHTLKNHVYNKIMWNFMDKYLSRSDSKLPQIIGLSASLSVDKAKCEEKAEKIIKTLMANLNVTIAPVEVRENIASLKLVQNKAQDEVFTVVRRANDEFANKIKMAMCEVEAMLRPYYDKYFNVLNEIDLRVKPVGKHGKQDYEEWVVHLLEDSKLIRHTAASRWFMGFAMYLRKFNDSLMMNDHVRSSDVKEYLEEFLEEQPSNETTLALMDIYRKHEPRLTINTNPLLEKLQDILAAQYRDKPNSRCIIFVRTRPVANALLSYLAEETRLLTFNLNAKLLTGANAKAEKLGMTKAGQEDTLVAFRSGSCKVLVSTAVAEEGLDIKECNLIVTYNYSTNEIGKLQRKGRGRAEDSRSIILAYSDSGIVPREIVNDTRTELAHKVLEKIRTSDSNDLKTQIVRIQVKAKEDRHLNSFPSTPVSIENLKLSNEYILLCIGCKTEITNSEFIQTINKQHHVVVDRRFLARADIVPRTPPELIDFELKLTGKICCKNSECKANWGSCMNYKKIPVCVLKGDCFILCDQNENWSIVEKWSEVPFYDSIPELDLLSAPILDSVQREDSESEEEFDYDALE